MRLSSLELQGFKSFPDKTRLEFDDGITAVVGPNGSGKSNIADAVRWVLGEQSTKTLRGSRMEDVIFSGTQERKSVGYASVELTVENQSGLLADEGEFTSIGRRLYRSGESEYRINGTPVRLRDVHELFMDTGMGRDGYSIIGQGRISEIVSAKSSQRREIFEEAAGIAKYRYRRSEAQRRLDSAQENLFRLNDILLELEDRVEPLRQQSEKAKKYLELAEEQKDLEISIWVEELDHLKKETQKQEHLILISKNDYEKTEKESQFLENKLAEIYEEMQQLIVAADERRQSIRNLEEEGSETDSKVAVYYNDKGHNQTRIDNLIQEQQGAGTSESQLIQEIKEKTEIFESLEKEFSNLKQVLLQKQNAHRNLLENISSSQEQLQGLLSRKNSLEQAMSQIHLEQAASESVYAESRHRLTNLSEKGGEHNKAVEEAVENQTHGFKEIKKQEEHIQSLKNSENGYLLRRNNQLDSYKDLEKKLEDLEREKQKHQARGRLLKEMESSMEGYAGSVRYILKQKEKGLLGGVYGPVSSLISTHPEHITAIETALGGAMQNIVVENESVAKQGIQVLRDGRAGRGTFLPLTSVKGRQMDFSHVSHHQGFIGAASELVGYQAEFQGIMHQLLGRVCVVDDLDTGTAIAREVGYRFRIVTLDGQVINAGGSFTGGTVSRSAGVLGRRHEIAELGKKVRDLKKELEELLAPLESSREKLAQCEASLTAIQGEIQSAEEERVRLGFSQEQLDKTLSSTKRNRDLAIEELEKLASRLDSIQKGTSTAKYLLEENDEKLQNLITEITEQETNLEDKQEELSVLINEVSALQMKELGKSNDISNCESELLRLKSQLENADQRSQELQTEKQTLETANEEIEKAVHVLKERKEKLVSEVEIHNKNIIDFMEKRTMLEQSTTDLRKQERELSNGRENVSRELVRLEERKNNMQLQYDSIISKLWDEYNLTRSHAVETARILEDPKESKARLQELRGQIRKLGSVNVEAVEEYKEVFERYTFLSKQVKDVEESRKQLLSLINELTGEMEVIFIEKFKQINHEFSKTFIELFGGGHGELRLEDDDDILEAGIEIHVQPPGKAVKNLSLLSGGEQSFVAIAIYFAILKVTPAPFVLLDEIEAALDDVNVVKYAQYLRSLSHETQFIAITHRRGTMEEADVLYGVTMQEEGVSKLLELNIQEIESTIGIGAD